MSTRPNVSTAAFTIASQLASELGRLAMISDLPPSAVQASATFFSSAALLAESTTLAPAPARTLAASAPNAPDAPVTIAVLPRTSNNDSGFFRKSSDGVLVDMATLTVKLLMTSSWPGLSRPSRLGGQRQYDSQ